MAVYPLSSGMSLFHQDGETLWSNPYMVRGGGVTNDFRKAILAVSGWDKIFSIGQHLGGRAVLACLELTRSSAQLFSLSSLGNWVWLARYLSSSTANTFSFGSGTYMPYFF